MEKKIVSRIMLALLLASMLTLTFNIQAVRAEPKTWYVDDSGGRDFTRIQDAIYAANPGDTVYVYNGTYYEHVYIYKSLTLIGENKYATIIDGSGYGQAVRTSFTQNVKLTGFTIRNAETGIELYRSSKATIVSNVITNSTLGDPYNWGGGIYVEYSSNNTVAGNTISRTTEAGIHVQQYSHHNTIVSNVISRNTEIEIQDSSGIFLDENTYENTVLDNVISKSHRGIYIAQLSHNNTIVGNTISELTAYEVGINIWGPNNRIIGNTITQMSYAGIQLNSVSSDGLYGVPDACANNIVSGNVITQSTLGINLILAASYNTVVENIVSGNTLGILTSDDSHENTIIGNLVSNNYYGIILFSSDDTKVYHNNFIDNTQQVLLSDSFNTVWNDGYPSGGNYWSDYADIDLFTGPSQDELGSDGIWDHPYVIDFENRDRYPLTEPWAPTTTATIDVAPNGLNLRSQGKWITAYIELPEGYDVSEIDISTIKLYSAIYVDPDAPTELGDYDSDGIPDLMVKFNKAEVISYVESALNSVGWGFSAVSFTITGRLDDGTRFKATDTVKLLFPGDVDDDADVDFNDFIIFSGCYGISIENPSYVPRADFNEDGTIDFNDFTILAANYGKTAI